VFRRLEPRQWPCRVVSRPAAAADRPEPWNTHQILRICRKTAVTVALPRRAGCPGAVHQAYLVLLLGQAARSHELSQLNPHPVRGQVPAVTR